jgi:LPXTG-motif cell wall-anchored protein
MGRPALRSTVLGSAAVLAVAAATVLPVSAGSPGGYTVPDGVEVLEVSLLGARGGNTSFADFVAFGGGGCTVTASLAVSAGDEITWILGTPGGDTTASTAASPGGAGGAGARPGGSGGATADTFDRSTRPGAGGGGASSLTVNATEQIVAAGGGGAGQNGTGAACSTGPEGQNGNGTVPTAGGGKTPDAGGIAGLGNGGSATPPPGFAGNSASDSPPGKGGDGGQGNFGGGGGGGGGGGISGGGGGAGQNGQFNPGNGSGAGGLSGVTAVPAGIAAPRYSGGEAQSGAVGGLAVIIETTSLATGKVGTAYSAALNAEFNVVFKESPVEPVSVSAAPAAKSVVWSLAEGSAPLPDGLSIDPNGSITGTPTESGSSDVTLAASMLDDSDDTRARSVVTLTLDIAQADPTTTTTAEPTTTTSEATTTTAAGGGSGSGTLPATGAAGVAPLVAAGAMLVGSGTAAALLARRRRAS